jgi:hypothetical protein
LSLDFDVHRDAWIVGKSAGIDEPELPAVPVRASKMPVASGARFVADNRAILTDYAVEQRRLPDVWPADKSDDWKIQTATAVGSDFSTSMKS